MEANGRLFDGLAPVARAVELRLGPDGLELQGEDVSRVLAYAGLVNLGEFGQELRIGYRPEPDLRVIAPKALLPGLAQFAPNSFHKGRIGLRWALLSAALTLGAAAVAAALFFGAPVLAEPLARITPPEIEQQLGDNVAAQLQLIFKPCEGEAAADAKAAIAPMVERLVEVMQPEHPISVEFVKSSAPNAVALPGGRVLITDGLFDAINQQDELAAVLAHELGHVRARDGLIAAYRHAGLGVTLELITGGTGLAQQAILLGGQVVEAGNTRRQEARADDAALAALAQLGSDPGALARAFQGLERTSNALRKMDGEKPGRAGALDFLASHPAIEERIAKAQAHAAPSAPPLELLDASAWAAVQRACSSEPPARMPTPIPWGN